MPRNLSTPPPCGSACGAQLELFAPPPLPAPAAGFDWDRNDVVIVGDSGGKDSGVLVHEVCTQADQAGQLHKVRVLHCDLGRTPNGHLIEWPGALEVARSHADLYGVPFVVRRSQRWPSLWDRIMDHGNFPGFFARFCTSDLKTAVGRDYVDEVAAELRLGRPIRAGYAMGMRAEESRARAKNSGQCCAGCISRFTANCLDGTASRGEPRRMVPRRSDSSSGLACMTSVAGVLRASVVQRMHHAVGAADSCRSRRVMDGSGEFWWRDRRARGRQAARCRGSLDAAAAGSDLREDAAGVR